MTYIAVLEGKNDNFGAFVPDVGGAVGAGDTAEGALESLRQSLATQLADLTERGVAWPVPTPAEQLDVSEYEPEEPHWFVEVTTDAERLKTR